MGSSRHDDLPDGTRFHLSLHRLFSLTCIFQGVTGAGKTTLLDVLASRATLGVVSGEIMIDGRPRDPGFQRRTGYAKQQDLHLPTTTVREALTFSAVLRQPRHISHADKIAYVDEVIKILEMEPYAEAIVGVPGEGMLLSNERISGDSHFTRPQRRAEKTIDNWS